MDKPAPLARILGLGFGLAMVFGGTVGVGILRLPGTLAATLGDSRLSLVFWIVGGFYVYARRAFGSGAGFVVGWSDWINEVATLAYGSMTAMTFLASLWPGAARYAHLGAVLIVTAFTALHWVGLRMGSSLTRLISLSIGLMMLILIVACLFVPPAAHAAAPLPMSAAALPLLSMGTLAALVSAMRNVLLTYDGWYSPIYLAEENTDPGRTLPRALIGGTVVLIVLYVAVNAALLRVLPLSALASSDLPAAAAAHLVFPRGGGELVTLISLLTVLSLVNATLLLAPRVLFAIGRDGLFTRKAAAVSAGGAPRARSVERVRHRAHTIRHVRADHRTRDGLVSPQLHLRLRRPVRAQAARARPAATLSRLRLSVHHGHRARGAHPRVDRRRVGGSTLGAHRPPVAGGLRAHLRRNRAPQAADGSAGSGRLNQSKSVGSPGSSAWENMRSICAAVVRPTDSGGSSWRAKKATSLVSMLGRALPPVSSQMKNSL